MRPKRFAPDDPREWLNGARSNLVRAEHMLPGTYLEDLCFDAQQAAEKAVKAVFIHRGIDFPYVHTIWRGSCPCSKRRAARCPGRFKRPRP
jgi:hypothetical protein